MFTAAEVRDAIERMDARSPARGAAMVARAWVDPGYKRRLLADGSAAAEEFGIEVGATRLMVVENTPEVHNLIVCTLCSCYPPDRLHALLVLSARGAGFAAGVVQIHGLSRARGT